MAFSAAALVFLWDSHGLCAMYMQELAALCTCSVGPSLGNVGRGVAGVPVLLDLALARGAQQSPGFERVKNSRLQ